MKQQNLNTRTLSFEHTKDTNLLANFFCGIESIDDFIHHELQDYVNMGGCEMVLVSEIAENNIVKCDFVAVRALKYMDYTAVPFYTKCGFFAAEQEEPGRNLFMYRVIIR